MNYKNKCLIFGIFGIVFISTNYQYAYASTFTYTDQEKDVNGLMFYDARYYDPTIPQFISPDNIDTHEFRSSSQSFNPYSYTSNNPINRVDPTGNIDINITLDNIYDNVVTNSVDFGNQKMIDYAQVNESVKISTYWDINQSSFVNHGAITNDALLNKGAITIPNVLNPYKFNTTLHVRNYYDKDNSLVSRAYHKNENEEYLDSLNFQMSYFDVLSVAGGGVLGKLGRTVNVVRFGNYPSKSLPFSGYKGEFPIHMFTRKDIYIDVGQIGIRKNKFLIVGYDKSYAVQAMVDKSLKVKVFKHSTSIEAMEQLGQQTIPTIVYATSKQALDWVKKYFL